MKKTSMMALAGLGWWMWNKAGERAQGGAAGWGASKGAANQEESGLRSQTAGGKPAAASGSTSRSGPASGSSSGSASGAGSGHASGGGLKGRDPDGGRGLHDPLHIEIV